MPPHDVIATIGYEGRAQHDVLRLLTDAAIERLVDVRIRAQSRKPGFSKSTLAAGLDSVGIEYQHLRDLGTPIDIRAEFRAGETETGRGRYLDYLRGDPAAQVALERLAILAGERRTAILCFELDYRVCHRLVVAQELERCFGIGAEHLGMSTSAR